MLQLWRCFSKSSYWGARLWPQLSYCLYLQHTHPTWATVQGLVLHLPTQLPANAASGGWINGLGPVTQAADLILCWPGSLCSQLCLSNQSFVVAVQRNKKLLNLGLKTNTWDVWSVNLGELPVTAVFTCLPACLPLLTHSLIHTPSP